MPQRWAESKEKRTVTLLIHCRTWKEFEVLCRSVGKPAFYLADAKYKCTQNVGVFWLVFFTIFTRPSYQRSGCILTLEYIHFVADSLKTLNIDYSMIWRDEFCDTYSVFESRKYEERDSLFISQVGCVADGPACGPHTEQVTIRNTDWANWGHIAICTAVRFVLCVRIWTA
jgi:hypothetical protein